MIYLAFIALMLTNGLRTCEVHRLDICDFDKDGEHRVMHIQRKGRVDKSKTIAVPQIVEELFEDYTSSREFEVSVAVKPVFERTKKKGAINEFYGKFIHEVIADSRKGKKGKLLVFNNQHGEKVFVKSVKGIKPKPFLEQAYTENSERTVATFGAELAKAVGNFISKNFKPRIK